MFKKYLQNFYNSTRLSIPIHNIRKILSIGFWFLWGIPLLTSSSIMVYDYPEKVRQFTHTIEFDYVDWTIKAIGEKIEQSSIRLEHYIAESQSTDIVREYIRAQREIQRLEAEISLLFSDPNVVKKTTAIQPVQSNLSQFRQYRDRLAPMAESILQSQISRVLGDTGLTTLGQPVPAVLFHSTPLPVALIVSPRESIQQDANISLFSDMTAEDMASLEDRVMSTLDVSALVVPVGGVGVYPTMVMATSNLEYLTETIAHEWVHNFLTLRPLGLNYDTSPELRTINETTASIAGKEIGELVLRIYYPELLPAETPETQTGETEKVPIEQILEPEVFSYREEMHKTRVTVDEMLSSGLIEEAEEYMEQRRKYFWENGYPIRRLNQAYFAFYGAYADAPGGAAGKDPVGPVVRAFRKQSGSLSVFLEQISWVTSLEELQRKVTIPVDD
ncbi:MAG: hypothetical protein GX577_08850 [Leptolinea sp.]|nr:hypothetical protein [Leptolinea sp.]